jgi:putative ABC transport system permease protein
VQEASAVQLLPLNGVASLWPVTRADRPKNDLPAAFHFVIGPRYFEAMGIPILGGRSFTWQDTADRQRVVVLSRAAAQRYFPNENAIGRSIRIMNRAKAEWQVVGVVADVRNQRLDRVPRPQMYVPIAQDPANTMTIVIRSRHHDPLPLVRPLRSIVHEIDAEQGVSDVKLLDQVVSDSVARWRVSTALFAGFGAVAIILALIGLFSVTASSVAQRSREIAIRLALGGSRAAIVRLILRSFTEAGVAGILLGLTLAVLIGRGLESLLYAVQPVDQLVFGVTTLGFVCVLITTAALSARGASRIHPIVALKLE